MVSCKLFYVHSLTESIGKLVAPGMLLCLRLIQDFDLERNSNEFSLKCLNLMGTGPGFKQEKIEFPRILPKNDVVVDIGGTNWVSLFPFLAVSNCPDCRYRETYYIDRWNDRKGTAVLKSFERGHADERTDVATELASISDTVEEQSLRTPG